MVAHDAGLSLRAFVRRSVASEPPIRGTGLRGLTFDTSSWRQAAKPAVDCPLDARVSRLFHRQLIHRSDEVELHRRVLWQLIDTY